MTEEVYERHNPELKREEHLKKLIEEKDKERKEYEEWVNEALNWREFELSKDEKRIQVLEASLADVKNQVEQVRKETARDIFKELQSHEAGWDGISVNAYWTKIIKDKYYCGDIETRELGVNIKPF